MEESSEAKEKVNIKDYREKLATAANLISLLPAASEKSQLHLLSILKRCCVEVARQQVLISTGSEGDNGYEFTLWLLGKLMVVFITPSLQKLHDEYVILHSDVVLLFEARNPKCFRKLCLGYIRLLQETEKHTRRNPGTPSVFPIYLSLFELQQNLQTTHCLEPITINSVEGLGSLKINITKVISRYIEHSAIFKWNFVKEFGSLLESQAKGYDTSILETTLCSMRVLVEKANPWLKSEAINGFARSVEHIFSLIPKPGTCPVTKRLILDESSQSSWTSIEKSAAKFLHSLCQPQINLTPSSTAQLLFVIERLISEDSTVVPELMKSLTFLAQKMKQQCVKPIFPQIGVSTWFRLLLLTSDAVVPAYIWADSGGLESSFGPNRTALESVEAKKVALSGSTPSETWPQMKDQLKLKIETAREALQTNRIELGDVTLAVRLSLVGMESVLRSKEKLYPWLTEEDYPQLNKLLRSALVCTVTLRDQQSCDCVASLLEEYLERCVELAHFGAVRANVIEDWFCLALLPFLTGSEKGPDPQLLEDCHLLNSNSTVALKSKCLPYFVKFPISCYRPWVAETVLSLLQSSDSALRLEAVQQLPWIVRIAGKSSNKRIAAFAAEIWKTGSSQETAALVKVFPVVICSYAGKLVVQEKLKLVCLTCTENTQPNKLHSLSSELVDVTLLLTFAVSATFREEERTRLFRSLVYHTKYCDTLRGIICSRLKEAALDTLESEDVSLQLGIIRCSVFAMQVYGTPVLQLIIDVLYTIAIRSSSPLITSWVECGIREISSLLGVSSDQLFLSVLHTISAVIMSLISPTVAWNAILICPQIFSLKDTEEALAKLLPNLLPLLIMQADNERDVWLLEEISACLKQRPGELIAKRFPYIYVHILHFANDKEKSVALKYIEEETKHTIIALKSSSFQVIHNELLCRLRSCKNQVLGALQQFAAEDERFSSSQKSRDLDLLPTYLQPRFLGILVHFDEKLQLHNASQESKVEVLASLTELLNMMGPRYVTTVRLKVLATIRTAMGLKSPSYTALLAALWDAFVRNVIPEELGPLLTQIVVSLLPLYGDCAEQVRSLLHYIIVENQSSLKSYVEHLYFFPELPGLEDVSYAIRVATKESDFRTRLLRTFRNITHEDHEVRLTSLKYLETQLQQNRAAIRDLMLNDSGVSDPIIPQLISGLLESCRLREESSLAVSGHCFGHLGAVDPGLLNFDESFKSDSSVCTPKLIDEAFVLHVLSTLGRTFLAPRDVQTLNSCSFTIQEILKVYSPDKGQNGVWSKLPEQLRIAFTPLLTSKYILRQRPEDLGTSGPLYKSPQCCDYPSWLYLWTASMMNKVRNIDALAIFTPSKQAIRRDVNFNLKLLPYVAMCALWDGPLDQHDIMQKEVAQVLSDGQIDRVPKLTFKRTSSDRSLVGALIEGDSVDSDLFQSGVQAVFYLMDFMNKWLSISQKEAQQNRANKHEKICKFVTSIPNVLLAQAAYKCRAYSRALLHLELLLQKNKHQLHEHLGFLQKIYVALDEPDGVAGVCAIRDHDPSLDEHISAYKANGRLQDALSCYERISRQEECTPEYYQGLLRCLLDLDMPHGALSMANGLREITPLNSSELDDYRAECCWRLGQWELLDQIVKKKENSSAVTWGIGLGRTLLAAKAGNYDLMSEHMEKVRIGQMRIISAFSADQSSYSRAYQNFVKLHSLVETEAAVAMLKPGSEEELVQRFKDLLKQWDSRLELVQTSIRAVEPILHVRRVVLNLAEEQLKTKHPNLASRIAAEVSKNLLTNARLARKAGHHQRAQTLLVACTGPNSPDTVYIEQAKLHWARGEQDQAITVLKRGIEKRFPPSPTNSGDWSQDPGKLEHLKARLLLTRYYELSGNADMDSIMKSYKEVVELGKTWEDGYFFLARYYDHVWNNLKEKEGHGDVAHYVIINFGKSLQYGNNHIYHSMPRLLELWFELGTLILESHSAKAKTEKNRMSKITAAIRSAMETIPAYKFLTAFPQLISRICHSHPDVATRLRELIANIVVSYPQQTMWMMVAVLRSSFKMRVKRCQEIVNEATSKKPELSKFFSDALELAKSLVDVANHPAGRDVNQLSISKILRKLPRLLSGPDFSQIMIPLEWSLTVTLPTTPGSHMDHNAFPKDFVYVTGIEDSVEVMPSLQKPKKVALRGSDGNRYVFLCKPKDDLRKDCRLMDFNKLINRFLLREPEARKRNLHIRTYAVIPLNEECGLIQWISNLNGLRQIILSLYKKHGIVFSLAELKQMMCNLKDSLEKKLQIFEKKMLPKYPPVFKDWFLDTFPEPQAWYTARLSFVRTTAVMSMVGYVVGLGDRHGENILFDGKSGDTVHVDFNCLFNKGETFDWPELVPFRLTHNMVDAMGPTGVEGSFRKCSEITLRILRTQADTLLSVLKPFIHDPLVEWSKAGGEGSKESGEVKNEKALEHVGNIERRLQGYLNSRFTRNKIVNLPLSVEGQVNQLIAESVDPANLAQMYIGWSAFM